MTQNKKPISVNSDSPTWPYVLAFAQLMESKLAKNRHKGDRNGWLRDSFASLRFRMDQEIDELDEAADRQESMPEIANEAADVANFAMMIADSTGLIEDEIIAGLEGAWMRGTPPIKRILFAWNSRDGTFFGPHAPQTETERDDFQKMTQATHFMILPTAPSPPNSTAKECEAGK